MAMIIESYWPLGQIWSTFEATQITQFSFTLLPPVLWATCLMPHCHVSKMFSSNQLIFIITIFFFQTVKYILEKKKNLLKNNLIPFDLSRPKFHSNKGDIIWLVLAKQHEAWINPLAHVTLIRVDIWGACQFKRVDLSAQLQVIEVGSNIWIWTMRNILSCFESVNVTHVGPHPNGAQTLVHLAGCIGGRKKVFLDQKQYRQAEKSWLSLPRCLIFYTFVAALSWRCKISGDMKVLYYLEIILNNKKISRKKEWACTLNTMLALEQYTIKTSLG